eukprot:5952027-Heterocapsa_arctica.AAC.1
MSGRASGMTGGVGGRVSHQPRSGELLAALGSGPQQPSTVQQLVALGGPNFTSTLVDLHELLALGVRQMVVLQQVDERPLLSPEVRGTKRPAPPLRRVSFAWDIREVVPFASQKRRGVSSGFRCPSSQVTCETCEWPTEPHRVRLVDADERAQSCFCIWRCDSCWESART